MYYSNDYINKYMPYRSVEMVKVIEPKIKKTKKKINEEQFLRRYRISQKESKIKKIEKNVKKEISRILLIKKIKHIDKSKSKSRKKKTKNRYHINIFKEIYQDS
jgi:hypothetical protein